MTTPVIIGPISFGSSLMITSIIKGIPNVLSYKNDNYFWESKVDTGVKLPIFKFASAGVFEDVVNKGFLSYNSSNLIVNSELDNPIQTLQNDFASWGEDLLASVEYTLSAKNVTLSINEDDVGSSTTPANNVYFVPANIYFNCTAQGHYNNINKPYESLANWFCNVDSKCKSKDIVVGWTEMNDCIIGYQYAYCPTGDFCGTSNCNGPCENSKFCEYKNSQFSCSESVSQFLDSHMTLVVVIAGVILFFIIGVIIIVILVLYNKRKKLISENAKPT